MIRYSFYNTKLRVILLILLFVTQWSCTRSQDPKTTIANEMKLFDVISFARSHFQDDERPVTRSDVYHNFDFALMKPSKKSSASVSSVQVFYNETAIVRVMLRSKFEDSDFEFKVFEDTGRDYYIFFGEQLYDSELENEQDDVVNGFFLVYMDQCYFVSFSEPLCIMRLNSDLKAVETLRFKANKVLYKTEVKYKDQLHLHSDIFYSPKKSFELTEETSIEDVSKMFLSKNDFQFYKELKIGWVKKHDHLPLWIFSGRHEYDLSAKP